MIGRVVIRIAFFVLALVAPLAAHAQDWKQDLKEFRIGLLGGENTSSRLARYDAFQHLLQQT
ncbi:MAG: hypothetical protein QOG25_4108, partial [Acetobacteraceae bacterium]|nr:hypothetical protein [Acetobacteraceae bacterium]